jgi:hypothetical protein
VVGDYRLLQHTIKEYFWVEITDPSILRGYYDECYQCSPGFSGLLSTRLQPGDLVFSGFDHFPAGVSKATSVKSFVVVATFLQLRGTLQPRCQNGWYMVNSNSHSKEHHDLYVVWGEPVPGEGTLETVEYGEHLGTLCKRSSRPSEPAVADLHALSMCESSLKSKEKQSLSELQQRGKLPEVWSCC